MAAATAGTRLQDPPSRGRARSAAPADRSSRSAARSASGRPVERDRPQHVQRGAQPVAGEQVVRKDDVARLLAAERQAAREHLLHHVLVADRAAHQRRCRAARSAISRPMLLITVATIALPCSRPSRCSWRAHISSTASPFDDAAARDRRRSRGRRRRRTPRPCWQPRSTTVRASRSGCVDPQCRLMLRPSGSIADDDGLEAEACEQLGRHGRRRAVGAVDGDAEARRSAHAFGKHRAQVIEIRADEIGARHRAGVARRAPPRSSRPRSPRPRARRAR